MGNEADYIKRIEIQSLWKGRKHVIWDLRPDVNILSGVNGVGKSTILNKSVEQLNELSHCVNNCPEAGVKFTFSPDDATYIHYDVVRSIDRPLHDNNLPGNTVDLNVKTELDWQLYQLQRRFLNYQVNIGNRIIEALSSDDPEKQLYAAQLSLPKRKFQNYVDELFSETGKKILRQKNEIFLEQEGEIIHPYLLSSGEKQLLVIMLTALVEDNRPGVLFMDEPEISLHTEWQQQLIDIIRDLNPNVQIILCTHSPAVIMNGWRDAVTDVSDILQ